MMQRTFCILAILITVIWMAFLGFIGWVIVKLLAYFGVV